VSRDVYYNLLGRLATAGFPVVLPIVTYWIYGQSVMLQVAQHLNLTSYVAILALSGSVLPARDFRADKGRPMVLATHMYAYQRVVLLQLVLSVLALLLIGLVAMPGAGFMGGLNSVLLFASLGLIHVVTIVTGVPNGFLLSRDNHALPNLVAALSRLIAVIALVICGSLGLSLSTVAVLWMLVFALYGVWIWVFVLRQAIPPKFSADRREVWVEVLAVVWRSGVYLLWAILATAFLAVPITYISYRWPAEFGGMNYAFLIGTSPASVFAAAMIPKANLIQDSAGASQAISALLWSSWGLACKVFVASLAAFVVSWPIHEPIVGVENLAAFRTATPMMFLATCIRLASWSCTQCAIAVRAERLVTLGAVFEAVLALLLAWSLSQFMGAIGVPVGLVMAAVWRIVYMVVVEIPRLKVVWRRYGSP
jgi:hypothetical protein